MEIVEERTDNQRLEKDAAPFSDKRLWVSHHDQKLAFGTGHDLRRERNGKVLLLCRLGLGLSTLFSLPLRLPFKFLNLPKVVVGLFAVGKGFSKSCSGTWNTVFPAFPDLTLMVVRDRSQEITSRPALRLLKTEVLEVSLSLLRGAKVAAPSLVDQEDFVEELV